jgi:hypothetical protein
MRITGTVELTEEEYILAFKHMERASKPREERALPTAADVAAFATRQSDRQLTSEDQVVIQKHVELLAYFRDLQLRARDGNLDAADYKWMCLHMNEDERPEDFLSAGLLIKACLLLLLARLTCFPLPCRNRHLSLGYKARHAGRDQRARAALPD